MVVPTRLIEATVEAPSVVEVRRGKKSVVIPVRAILRNTSDHDLVLHSPDSEEARFCHVLDPDHREVTRHRRRLKKKPRKGVEAFQSITVAAGKSHDETEKVELKARTLKPGIAYTVRTELYGQIAETEFVVVESGSAPKKTAKTTQAKKAAAKKKATKKKATKKKAARKKAAKRR